MEISAINYGGIITSWKAKDREGNYKDIVLGFNNLYQYEAGSPYFGAIIGRYGNRIAKGKFTLNGKNYTLAVNNGENHLHGGLKGFDKVVWDTKDAKPGQYNITLKIGKKKITKKGIVEPAYKWPVGNNYN